MKNKFLWASILTLAITTTSQLETMAATNGMVVITTRLAQDLSWASTDLNNIKGPGQVSPGDAEMAAVLGYNGYSSRYIIDAELNPNKTNQVTLLPGDANFYLYPPADANFNASLVILSGSSGSADVPPVATNGVPVMIGEHSCIRDRVLAWSCYMYVNGSQSTDIRDTAGAGKYMIVVATNHPIMQGIPLDAQGRVKIFRDVYPEENSHVPPTGKPNYEYAWTTQNASNAAPGTVVLGLLDGNTNKSVLAVNDIGGLLGNGTTNGVRLVHWLVNEQGSGGSRRCFNSLTEMGRLIFIRSVRWALGEPLTPVQTFKVIDVTAVSKGVVRLRWQGSALKHYQLIANADLNTSNWKTVVDDIPGADGIVSRTFDVSAAPQTLFMRIRAMP